ncbi:5-formyltetrahydrofolate cyclo-ligase [Batrachochytrium salamandrivorans]|nr:5-formyltetrahydrofolate cyclo-ligase [Batrachochytrium salamandrivorans]
MLKAELRKRTRLVLGKIPQLELEVQSYAITTHALQVVDSQSPSGVCLFLAKADSEVQTSQLIRTLLQRRIRVYVPFISGKQTMDFYQLFPEGEDVSKFPTDRWQIPVLPNLSDRIKATPKDMDLVFFPGAAFQLDSGNRLGQGMGFYDLYFAEYDAKRAALGLARVTKIGLALNEMLVDHVPTEPHDVQMDGLITPSKVVYY